MQPPYSNPLFNKVSSQLLLTSSVLCSPILRYLQARAYCCAHHYLMVFRFSNGADPRFLTEVYGTTSREQWSGVVKPARVAMRQWRVKVLGVSRGNNCVWKCNGVVGKERIILFPPLFEYNYHKSDFSLVLGVRSRSI